MSRTEKEILQDLRDAADEARRLFSNRGQAEQERTAVAGLLRVLRVPFEESEIIKAKREPIDVSFRDAQFQVTEILDEGRRRNLEIGQRTKRWKGAQRLADLLEPGLVSGGPPISPADLIEIVRPSWKVKAERYGGRVDGIDLLIYLNRKGVHVFPSGPLPPLTEEDAGSWRSLSVIMEGCAAVLWARETAPDFLKENIGEIRLWTRGPESVFPVLAK